MSRTLRAVTINIWVHSDSPLTVATAQSQQSPTVGGFPGVAPSKSRHACKYRQTKAGVEKEIEAAKAGRKTVKNMFKKDNNVDKMDQKAENVS